MKPYDLKELGTRLKDKGLVAAEDAAKDVVKEVFGFLKESADASPSKVDDFLKPFYEMAEEKILVEVDKIDGQQESAAV